jgi:hypothetical protein
MGYKGAKTTVDEGKKESGEAKDSVPTAAKRTDQSPSPQSSAELRRVPWSRQSESDFISPADIHKSAGMLRTLGDCPRAKATPPARYGPNDVDTDSMFSDQNPFSREPMKKFDMINKQSPFECDPTH